MGSAARGNGLIVPRLSERLVDRRFKRFWCALYQHAQRWSVDDLMCSAGPSGHHRTTADNRLQQHVGATLALACQTKYIGGAVPCCQLPVRASANQHDTILQTQTPNLLFQMRAVRAVSDNQQHQVRASRCKAGDGINQNMEALMFVQMTDRKNDRSIGRQV